MVYVINDEQLTRRKLVTIDGSKVTTETAIPLGLNINLPGVKAAGADVRLAKLDGTSIAREIECKDVPNVDDVTIWYPWDTTSGQDDQFWVYWGNPNLAEPAVDSTYGSQAVWDANFKLVLLMNNDPTGTIIDSTSNDNNGTTSGAMTADDLINVGYSKGLAFDGNDYIIIPAHASLQESSTFTDEFYIDHDSGAGLLSNDASLDTTGALDYNIYTSKLRITEHAIGHILSSTPNIPTPLSYIGISRNNSNLWVIRFDDADAGSVTNTNIAESFGNIHIGRSYYGYLTGTLAQYRRSNIARSVNWRDTTYNNLKNPTTIGTAPFYKSFGLSQHQRRILQFIN